MVPVRAERSSSSAEATTTEPMISPKNAADRWTGWVSSRCLRPLASVTTAVRTPPSSATRNPHST